jgi:hypothetical protein
MIKLTPDCRGDLLSRLITTRFNNNDTQNFQDLSDSSAIVRSLSLILFTPNLRFFQNWGFSPPFCEAIEGVYQKNTFLKLLKLFKTNVG